MGLVLKSVKRLETVVVPSVTVTIKPNVPTDVVVPLTVPPADIVSPDGNPVADQISRPPPPAAVKVYVKLVPATTVGRIDGSWMAMPDTSRRNVKLITDAPSVAASTNE